MSKKFEEIREKSGNFVKFFVKVKFLILKKIQLCESVKLA